MNAQDLRKLLEQTENKLSIFENREKLNEYEYNAIELYGLINDFLSDEEKLKLFDYQHFRNLKVGIKCNIVELISDDNIKLQILSDNEILEGAFSDQIVNIVKKMNDNAKLDFINNDRLIEKYQIEDHELQSISLSLNDEAKVQLMMNTNLIKRLKLKDFQIGKIIKSIKEEEYKKQLLNVYELPNNIKVNIISTFKNDSIIKELLKQRNLKKFEKMMLLQALDVKSLKDLLENHKEFLRDNNISFYEVVHNLDSEKQKEIATRIESIDLPLDEKRKTLAILNPDVKQSIDTTNFPKEYKKAIEMQKAEYGLGVILDLEKNLEDYRGLDELISVKPEVYTEEQKDKLMKLCDICPNMTVLNYININNNSIDFSSTGKEYKEAEEWISSVIDGLDPEYSKAQKMAVIDNKIGKKISYTPDFDTEEFDSNNCRALWKIISTGYGVCNGIANVELYMLKKVGIECENVSSKSHNFLKIKDIEIPLVNGEIVRGNTILDPTWNLASHRFGGKPDNFCISYEQARKNDVDNEGRDHNCHKNDEKLNDATLNLDEQSLRQLFKSVNLADKDGKFPIGKLIEDSKRIDEVYANQLEQNISKQFELLREYCPEFAMCQNSSMSIISDVLLSNENTKFNKCVVNRVYSRTDKEKKPILYTYIDSDELGKRFYYADKEQGKFIELPQEEFEKQFECYETDLEKHNRF